MNADRGHNTREQETRVDLAAAHRLAVREGLNEGTWNHLSVTLPDSPEQMLISPGYTHWSQVNASNLSLVGPDGSCDDPNSGPIRAGWVIHGPIHRLVPNAACLMHVHAPYITALSMRKDVRLDTSSSQQAAQFHGDVAYFELYDGLLDEESEGERMAEALGENRVLMMRNHGALVAGPSIAHTYIDLYQLERACMYQILASTGGHELTQIPTEIAATMSAQARAGNAAPHFEGMKKMLDELEPNYAH